MHVEINIRHLALLRYSRRKRYRLRDAIILGERDVVWEFKKSDRAGDEIRSQKEWRRRRTLPPGVNAAFHCPHNKFQDRVDSNSARVFALLLSISSLHIAATREFRDGQKREGEREGRLYL